jgi:hypothetical protein
MKRSSRPLRTADLPKSLHQRLNTYALAAGAAGVSALALAPAADAKIVYTKANIRILANQPFSLDVNHDGVWDFMIRFNASSSKSWPYSAIHAGITESGSSPNVVVMTQPGFIGFAAALSPDVPVWKKRRFGSYVQTLAQCQFIHRTGTYKSSRTTATGPWRNVQSRYLGLKFSISGQIHYGWARLNVKLNKKCNFVVTLTGYAYETIPNKLILTGHTKGPNDVSIEEPDAALTVPYPEPASLGALALGSPGLSIWKREKPTAAAR